MLALVDSPKQIWHRHLVAHPATHAWVLNLYRAGEQHPESVDDYFPARHAPWPWLADQLTRHAGDERRHARMYARAIERLGEPVEELHGPSVFNEVIRSCTPASFRIVEGDAPDVVRRKIAHFCAHAHFLEKRIARSLAYHLDACERAGHDAPAAVVARVHADEERHLRTTLEAVHELVDRRTAAELLDVHRRGERRANLVFSRLQVRAFLARFRGACPVHLSLAYRLSAALMEEAADHV
jgi:hypothetical protein